MSQSQPEEAHLLDLSGSASILEAIKIHFEIQSKYQTINKEQKLILEVTQPAHRPDDLELISFEKAFEIEDQSVKFQGICTEDYSKYANFVEALYGGKDVKVAPSIYPDTLYLVINNKTKAEFFKPAKTFQYTSKDRKSVINGFYKSDNTYFGKEATGNFETIISICKDGKSLVFLLPKDLNFQISTFPDFLQTARQILSTDLYIEKLKGEVELHYPHIHQLEKVPNLSFMKDMNGVSNKFKQPIVIFEFNQKNKFILDQYGAQFEATTSASAGPRSMSLKVETQFIIDRSFFCVMYSHTGKPLNISYIPGHEFLKPV